MKTWQWISFGVAVTVVFWLLLAPAYSAPPGGGVTLPCNTRDHVQKVLEKHGEFPAHAGVTKQGALLEVFVNPETGLWSIVVHVSEVKACLVEVGDGWHKRTLAEEGPET